MPEHYFPEPEDESIAPFTRAFVSVMFAHAEFEHRLSDLLNVISGGEKVKKRWTAKDRAEGVKELCMAKKSEHPNGLPETDAIAEILTVAFPLCNARNWLAHGIWWRFDENAARITVHGDKVASDEDEDRDFTVEEIDRITFDLKNLEAELYKLQHAIEERSPSGLHAESYSYMSRFPRDHKTYPVKVDIEKATLTWRGMTFRDLRVVEGGRYSWQATREGATVELRTATKGVADLKIGQTSFDCQMAVKIEFTIDSE
jgi:hypothetical protein